MILFALSLFGYMILLIFVKWSINWQHRMLQATCSDGYTYDGSHCNSTQTAADLCPFDYGGSGDGCQPPNLITTLINIALQPGSVDEPMYAGQASVQTAILLIAFLCVPVLLCAKPCILHCRNKKKVI
jgi:V-type H+-transporting ATPase subunit a